MAKKIGLGFLREQKKYSSSQEILDDLNNNFGISTDLIFGEFTNFVKDEFRKVSEFKGYLYREAWDKKVLSFDWKENKIALPLFDFVAIYYFRRFRFINSLINPFTRSFFQERKKQLPINQLTLLNELIELACSVFLVHWADNFKLKYLGKEGVWTWLYLENKLYLEDKIFLEKTDISFLRVRVNFLSLLDCNRSKSFSFEGSGIGDLFPFCSPNFDYFFSDSSSIPEYEIMKGIMSINCTDGLLLDLINDYEESSSHSNHLKFAYFIDKCSSINVNFLNLFSLTVLKIVSPSRFFRSSEFSEELIDYFSELKDVKLYLVEKNSLWLKTEKILKIFGKIVEKTSFETLIKLQNEKFQWYKDEFNRRPLTCQEFLATMLGNQDRLFVKINNLLSKSDNNNKSQKEVSSITPSVHLNEDVIEMIIEKNNYLFFKEIFSDFFNDQQMIRRILDSLEFSRLLIPFSVKFSTFRFFCLLASEFLHRCTQRMKNGGHRYLKIDFIKSYTQEELTLFSDRLCFRSLVTYFYQLIPVFFDNDFFIVNSKSSVLIKKIMSFGNTPIDSWFTETDGNRSLLTEIRKIISIPFFSPFFHLLQTSELLVLQNLFFVVRYNYNLSSFFIKSFRTREKFSNFILNHLEVNRFVHYINELFKQIIEGKSETGTSNKELCLFFLKNVIWNVTPECLVLLGREIKNVSKHYSGDLLSFFKSNEDLKEIASFFEIRENEEDDLHRSLIVVY